MAEALLRDRLGHRGVDASVSSAGLVTEERPPTEEVIELMKARKLDVSGHESRVIDPAMVSGSDLVIGMAREHVRESVLLEPPSFGRTFTLRELVRLGEGAGPREPDQSFEAWLVQVGEGRTPAAHLSLSDEDDVEDPMGRRFGVYKRVANDIEKLVDRFVDLGFPRSPRPDAEAGGGS